ncbi:hypothetical protein [Arsenophonus nasoniae]|uniref:Uncharacterized protein n=1 Tax=Arsenophonus nasoniae TaxID=638 RepID=A0AA95K830_9GAMM|nr:hypothetical protein [Arsenophonus nasoniae]WGL95973.1 hypothetical protein QE207_05145 [Arsenophonus nasoniae]
MKVKCINNKDENSNIIEGLEVGKVYEVFTHDMHDYHYVYLDNLIKLGINCSDYKKSKYFQVHQEKESTQKTLRDEFAMAAMKGDWAAQNETGLAHYSTQDIEYLQKAAKSYYMMADAMLKVRNENEQTKE